MEAFVCMKSYLSEAQVTFAVGPALSLLLTVLEQNSKSKLSALSLLGSTWPISPSQ